jgi:uncharacterized protein YeeX (DUF496 family)
MEKDELIANLNDLIKKCVDTEVEKAIKERLQKRINDRIFDVLIEAKELGIEIDEIIFRIKEMAREIKW